MLLVHGSARPLLTMLDAHERALSAALGRILSEWEHALDVPDNKAEAQVLSLLGSYMVRVGDQAVAIQDRQWARPERKDVQTFRAERIAWVRAQGAALAVNLTTQMRARVTRILDAGLAAGIPPDKLRRQIAAVIPALPGISAGRRAEMIARTELHNAATWAQEREALGLAERGAHLVKTWTATMDARTRRAHRAANGQVRELTQDFIVGGRRMSRPGDPRGGAENVIRCRCVARFMPRGHVDEDRQRRAADMLRAARQAGDVAREIARMTAEMDPALAKVVNAAAQADPAYQASVAAIRAAWEAQAAAGAGDYTGG